ncbi:MAG TPA: ferritin-like domain-containing protein [Candidatus Binatia bacterium]
MEYVQHNPLPIPPGGPYETLDATIRTVLDWQYELKRKNLLQLYEKGKTLAWNANDLDWSIDVDPERLVRERVANGAAQLMNTLMNPPIKLQDEEAVRMQLHMNSFMLSQFLHGEQGALLATAKIVQSVPWEEAKFYAANQVADEARHVEVYHRYLTEKLGVSYGINEQLRQLLDTIICDNRWDITFLGMQIMVEGLALAAFGVTRMQMADEPLIQDLIGRVMADESRHVAFGVLSLQDLYTNEMSSTDLKEREDFVIEATHLLRDRLLMEAVFERLGWDVKLWVDWAKQTPFMIGFRQMMFSKIVPNLKRLGLLTPRVRDAYEKLDLLKFENMKDSVEDPEVTPPHELVELLMQFMSANPAAQQNAGATPAA